MHDPSISIITVVYNGADYLETAMQSVLHQEYPELEYIIIDGGSTDGSLEIIKRYEDQLAYWVSEPDDGIYNAMNKGLAVARGDIIGLLNADDYYLDGALRKVADVYRRHGGELWYGKILKLRQVDGEDLFIELEPDLQAMERRMSIFHPATFVHRTVYERIGTFDESFKLAADYEFLLRAYKSGCCFQYVDQPLSVYRYGGASSSALNLHWEGYRILRKYNLPYMKEGIGAIVRFIVKYNLRKLLSRMLRLLGFESLIEQRTNRKWRSLQARQRSAYPTHPNNSA